MPEGQPGLAYLCDLAIVEFRRIHSIELLDRLEKGEWPSRYFFQHTKLCT